MQDWIHEIYRDQSSLIIELNKKESLDMDIFQRMANDQCCLNCVIKDKEKGIIMYSINNLVTLNDVLEQHSFENEEGYFFLIHLLEMAIAVNRNKPVYFHPDYIFFDEHIETVYFMVVPLGIEEWMFNKEQTKEWIEYLYRYLKTTTAFEIPGYLIRFISSPEFSLPNLILGLKNMQHRYYPRKFSFFKKRKESSFRIEESIHSSYQSKPVQMPSYDNATQVLGFQKISSAYLEINEVHYELFETTLIGRSYGCDIQLSDDAISLEHCKIVCENDRYYIQDLKSLNGTYLNEKKVQRKMRLKNGMIVRFANIEAMFHQ
ncbi:FHA domain-containing protein [Floccifex sp.]|uniref:FHA domain-containing protein n=1 Tax=Floccifex sp. TaxID=2815810 RepID=UPI0029FF39ED|nr:FHA domain-containing protein [Floccifex sp.]MDD7280854.1 FHA domain-containing protein [Erysipelotrichaceae bacterium]MDY2958318.1 FHA domain-containing protein [Floccifex sp.]